MISGENSPLSDSITFLPYRCSAERKVDTGRIVDPEAIPDLDYEAVGQKETCVCAVIQELTAS